MRDTDTADVISLSLVVLHMHKDPELAGDNKAWIVTRILYRSPPFALCPLG